MFANQRALEVPALKQTARAIGLDGAAFDQCLDSGKWAGGGLAPAASSANRWA